MPTPLPPYTSCKPHYCHVHTIASTMTPSPCHSRHSPCTTLIPSPSPLHHPIICRCSMQFRDPVPSDNTAPTCRSRTRLRCPTPPHVHDRSSCPHPHPDLVLPAKHGRSLCSIAQAIRPLHPAQRFSSKLPRPTTIISARSVHCHPTHDPPSAQATHSTCLPPDHQETRPPDHPLSAALPRCRSHRRPRT